MQLLRKKIRRGLYIFRSEGILGFLILCLQFLQKHIRRHSSSGKKKDATIYTKARYNDIIAANSEKTSVFEVVHTQTPSSFAWVMPPPGKGSGGHLNIFRFIEFLEKAGYECKIYLFIDGRHGGIDEVIEQMGDSYPQVKALSSMQWLDTDESIKDADGIFATSWETAYASYAQKINAIRFYFVQDFEPYFYPVGGMYALAENTYKLGFYGVTAGGWLENKLATEYNMQVKSFDFASDPDLYRYTNNNNRKEIFYYARPYTERRGFEIGILTLDIFHKMHPEYIINLAGADVSEYNIPFPYNNLKTLEVNQLNDIYNRCAAALILSYTNMSLLPLELLGCGTIPVVNDGPNNRLVSNNPYIGYAENTPYSLARKLSEVVMRKDLVSYSKKASKSVKTKTWDESGEQFVKIVESQFGAKNA
jgi:hypothetical protein